MRRQTALRRRKRCHDSSGLSAFGAGINLLALPARVYDRIKNLHIARTATEIARQAIANVCFSWIGISFEQIYSGHYHPRRADAALGSTAIDERLLNCVQLFATRDA